MNVDMKIDANLDQRPLTTDEVESVSGGIGRFPPPITTPLPSRAVLRATNFGGVTYWKNPWAPIVN